MRSHPFDPPVELDRLRDNDPLCPLSYPDGHVGWLVTSYELARAVLVDQRFSARSELKRVPVARPGADPFIGQPALPGWLVDMDPPAHTRIKRLLAGQFTWRRMHELRPRIAGIVDDHLDTMAAAHPLVDLVESFALPVPSRTICELLGVPYADRAEFQRNSTILFSLGVSAREATEAMGRLEAFLRDLVDHRRRRPAGDLLSGLASDSDLSAAEIAGVGVLLLTAGHETTAASLSLGTFALLCHPDQLAVLRDDPGMIDNGTEELLRYLTIFQFGVPRTPLVDVELAGRVIRAGETVTVSLPAANRDPGRFARPSELDMRRHASGHLAFGHGIHQCLGQNLARMELRVGLAALFRRFPQLRLAVPAGAVPLAHDMGFYGVHTLPVRW
jgi:cytochrome P450